MEFEKTKLRYVILPGRQPPPALETAYHAAYRCWKEVWLDAFKELEGAEKIYSDDFTRQDEVGALFHGNDCIGMSFFHRVDMHEEIGKDDSYFKVWPPEAIRLLTQYGPDILVCSNFTVHQNFRRQVTNVSTKDLVMALIVKHFQNSGVNAMTGTMRNNKGMNDCTYRHGATPLIRDVVHHGVNVDLVGFFHDAVHECDLPQVAEFARAAWLQRLGNVNFPAKPNAAPEIQIPFKKAA